MGNDSRMLRRALALLILAPLFSTLPAFAQDKVSTAEGLFRDARHLMKKGDLAGACAKFAESERLDPSPGTLLNLALCHDKQGKIATAWAEFLEAKRLAQTQHRDKVAAEAERRAAELGPKVSYLTIVLSQKVPGLAVEIDKVKLDSAALDAKIPVDPGERTVTISAPGYSPATMKITIGADHDLETLDVPKLVKSKKAESPPSAPAPAAAPARHEAAPAHNAKLDTGATSPHTSVLPFVVGGAGVVALGVGTAFAFLSKSTYNSANSLCPSHTGCSNAAMDKRRQATTQANVANVALPLGVVGIGVGVVLLLTGSSSSHSAAHAANGLHVSGYASATGAGVALSGVTF